jgi:hypothetical protein
MEGAREFLEAVRHHQLAKGHFRGLLHLVVGRVIRRDDGRTLSRGVTWRQLAELLKNLRWDKEFVREVGLLPAELPPRDRGRYWYAAIIAAGIDTPRAAAEADVLAAKLRPHGLIVTPPFPEE